MEREGDVDSAWGGLPEYWKPQKYTCKNCVM